MSYMELCVHIFGVFGNYLSMYTTICVLVFGNYLSMYITICVLVLIFCLQVEEVFTCRIQDLCDNDNIRTTQFRTGPGYTLPVYLGGKHRIWGLTGIFVHQTLTLLAPGLYTFKIQHVV